MKERMDFDDTYKAPSKRHLIIPIVLGSLVIAAAIIFAVVWAVKNDKDCDNPTSSGSATYKSGHGEYQFAAVAADSKTCSEIGRDIMARKKGNAVDATVAALICTGVMNAHSAGIGGGSFFVIYDKKQGWHAVNARESAPGAASRDMYAKKEDRQKSVFGGMSVGVPGEVRGMYEVHSRFGSLPWKDLWDPSIDLLTNGFELHKPTYDALKLRAEALKDKTGFEPFLDSAMKAKPIGSIIKIPKLAATFSEIANNPFSFYNGTLAQDIVTDVTDRGGIITLNDLKNYNVSWKKPVKLDLPGNLTLYSMPPPGSGVVISHIMSILSGYGMTPSSLSTDSDKILTYHRIVEAMKFAYGKRSALGDEDFVDVKELVENMTSRAYGDEIRQRINDARTYDYKYYDPAFYNPEDAGTTHLSVADVDGNLVSVTSTVNMYFGSKVIGQRTGIVFNNEMGDFSTPNLTNSFGIPPSESNFIVPGKRPMSSMSPTIVIDNTDGSAKLVVGASGGSKITSTTALLAMDVLWFNKTMTAAMDNPRLHHQLLPNRVDVEKTFSEVVVKGLKAKGHEINYKNKISVAHGIAFSKNSLMASSDFRKGGQPAGY